jgi:ATP-dependent exoDNAse (exonuclease V) alpha subunit
MVLEQDPLPKNQAAHVTGLCNAITIHKFQGHTCAKLILNPGNTEFASGFLLVGATRTISFKGLAFAPFPNFSRLEQVNKCKGLKLRLKEEKRMEVLEMAASTTF